MRAARIHAFGEQLRIDDVPEPQSGPDEVLFQVGFIGVNPMDVWLTQGTVAGGGQRLPFIPGTEATGEIDGAAVLVTGGGLGVRRDGLYRERAAVPRAVVMPLPGGADPAQVAAAGVAGRTAWMLVHEVARIEGGDRVVVLGASGGVGSLVMQLAATTGATVWGQTSTEDKVSFIEGVGAQRAVVASPGELRDAVAELEPTVIFDPLGDGFTAASIEALRPFGRIALFGASAGPRADIDLRTLYRKSIQLLTYSGTIEPEERMHEALERVLDVMARGDLRVVVDEVLPLDRAAEAHRRILERRVRGKLLLAP